MFVETSQALNCPYCHNQHCQLILLEKEFYFNCSMDAQTPSIIEENLGNDLAWCAEEDLPSFVEANNCNRLINLKADKHCFIQRWSQGRRWMRAGRFVLQQYVTGMHWASKSDRRKQISIFCWIACWASDATWRTKRPCCYCISGIEEFKANTFGKMKLVKRQSTRKLWTD